MCFFCIYFCFVILPWPEKAFVAINIYLSIYLSIIFTDSKYITP